MKHAIKTLPFWNNRMCDRAQLVVPQSALPLCESTVDLCHSDPPHGLTPSLQVWHGSTSDTRGVKVALSSCDRDEIIKVKGGAWPKGRMWVVLAESGASGAIGNPWECSPGAGPWQDTAAPPGDGSLAIHKEKSGDCGKAQASTGRPAQICKQNHSHPNSISESTSYSYFFFYLKSFQLPYEVTPH